MDSNCELLELTPARIKSILALSAVDEHLLDWHFGGVVVCWSLEQGNLDMRQSTGLAPDDKVELSAPSELLGVSVIALVFDCWVDNVRKLDSVVEDWAFTGVCDNSVIIGSNVDDLVLSKICTEGVSALVSASWVVVEAGTKDLELNSGISSSLFSGELFCCRFGNVEELDVDAGVGRLRLAFNNVG